MARIDEFNEKRAKLALKYGTQSGYVRCCFFPGMADKDVDDVIDAVKTVLSKKT